MTITKTDLAALRKADAICFDHNVRRGDGRYSAIRCIKRVPYDNTDPFAQEVTHVIEVASRAFTYSGPGDTDNLTGFEMLHSAQVTETWRTIVSLLRVGDEISLTWAADNGNGYLQDAGLYRDELKLTVRRGEKTSLTFHVATSVCQNNTARMIRPLAYELA